MFQSDDPKADASAIPPIFEEDIGMGSRRGTTHISDPVTQKLIAEMEAERIARENSKPTCSREFGDQGVEL